MVKMYVRHRVADFNKWKLVFDEHDSVRRQFGCKSTAVFTNIEHPNEVLIVSEWDSKEQAMQFGQSPSLKEAMESASVLGMPEISFAG